MLLCVISIFKKKQNFDSPKSRIIYWVCPTACLNLHNKHIWAEQYFLLNAVVYETATDTINLWMCTLYCRCLQVQGRWFPRAWQDGGTLFMLTEIGWLSAEWWVGNVNRLWYCIISWLCYIFTLSTIPALHFILGKDLFRWNYISLCLLSWTTYPKYIPSDSCQSYR